MADYIKAETLTKDLILSEDIDNGNNIVFDAVDTQLLLEKV